MKKKNHGSEKRKSSGYEDDQSIINFNAVLVYVKQYMLKYTKNIFLNVTC